LSASQVKIWYTRPKSSEPDKLIPLFESEDESSELQLDKIDIKETGKDREIVHGEIENPPMPDKVVPQQIKIAEGKVGVTYESLIGHVMRGETKITIQDPYVSLLYQLRNLIDFLDFVVRFKDPNQVAAVHLITRKNMDILDQETNLAMIAKEIEKRGLEFTWEFNKEAHESYVILHNNKAEIALGRGLDIYTKPEANNLVADRLPICRSCHEFKVYIFPSDEE
jgi:ATP-dependent Lon protease